MQVFAGGDLLDALHLDVEHAHLAGLGDGGDGREGGAVGVAGEGGVFDEGVGGDEGGEGRRGGEVVVLAVDFAGARRAGCVCRRVVREGDVKRGARGGTGDGEAEDVGVVGEETLEDGGFAGAGGAGDHDGARVGG